MDVFAAYTAPLVCALLSVPNLCAMCVCVALCCVVLVLGVVVLPKSESARSARAFSASQRAPNAIRPNHTMRHNKKKTCMFCLTPLFPLCLCVCVEGDSLCRFVARETHALTGSSSQWPLPLSGVHATPHQHNTTVRHTRSREHKQQTRAKSRHTPYESLILFVLLYAC